MRNIVFVILLLSLFAQKSKADLYEDSLLNVVKSTRNDSLKIDGLNKLFLHFEFSDTTKAERFLNEAIMKSSQIGDNFLLADCYIHQGFFFEDKSQFENARKSYIKAYSLYKAETLNEKRKYKAKQGMALALRSVGIGTFYLGKLDSALQFMNRAQLIYEQLKDNSGLAKTLMSKGTVYTSIGSHLMSLRIQLRALKLFEELKDERYTYKVLMNIGVIHLSQGSYKLGIEYFDKSLQLAIKHNDLLVQSNCYINSGACYTKLFEYDKAIELYNKSLEIREKFGDKSGISSLYINIANNYYYKQNFPKSYEYHLKALDIKKEIGDVDGESRVYLDLSLLKNEEGKYLESISLLNQSMTISLKLNNLDMLDMIYKYLSINYDSLNNQKEALRFHKLYMAVHDSLYNAESGRQLKEMEARFQNERKQNEINQKEVLLKKKQLEISKEKSQKIIVAIALFFMIVIAAAIYRNFRNKKKANILLAEQKAIIEDKNEELNQQNAEIASQRDNLEVLNSILEQKNKEIEEKKNHIEEIHNELKDSIYYAERIQKAVLPSTDYARQLHNDFFILYRPKDIVSGDFYFFERRGKWLFVAVADCTGHGVPGAFMSMMGIAFLNEIIARDDVFTAGNVLDNLRSYVIRSLQQKGVEGEQKDGMDIALVVINTDTNEMQFAGANNSLYMVRKELSQDDQNIENKLVLNEIKGDKQPIGIYVSMTPFANHDFVLNKGDQFYLLSDGYEDQFGGPKFKKFYAKNLKELILSNSERSLSEQKQILETTIIDWIGDYEQVDDITILGLKW